MEEFQILINNAKKNVQIADHMLIMTYPMIKEPKLLLAVMQNVHSSLSNALTSALSYERLFKRIPPYSDSFDAKLFVFKDKIMLKHKINVEYFKLLQEVNEVLVAHKQSPMEFARDDRFVICSSNYRMKTISVDDMKKYIAKTKMFISEMEVLVSKDAGIFK